MIGEVHVIGSRVYVEMNNSGTLERMPTIKWYWVLVLYLKDYFKKMSYDEVRQFMYEKSHDILRRR